MKDKYFFHHLNSRFFQISGKDSKSFIQNLITNDIEKCNDGAIIYSCILTPQGKFLADFFIFNISENYFFEINEIKYHEILISNTTPYSPFDILENKSLLLENNFDNLNAIDWDKGCYVGQEITARMKYR